MNKYIATKYRYADGIAYRPNLYKLQKFDVDGWHKTLGGMIILKNKVFAFVGPAYAVQDKIESIMKSGHTKAFVWGNSIEEALTKIRPFMELGND